MFNKIFGIGTTLFVTLFVLTILGGSWYTIDQGERGVILRNGAIVGIADPGLGFKWPLIKSVVRISTQVGRECMKMLLHIAGINNLLY